MTCHGPRPTCRRNTSPSPGPGSGSTSTKTSSRSTSSARTRRARSPNSRACSKTSTSSIWPQTVTVRAKRSPGTCWRPSSRAFRSSAWFSMRSPSRRSWKPPPTRATWTSTWSTPRRPAASWTGCTATRSARCCGRRWRPSCPRAGSNRWPPASSSSANATGWRSAAPRTGTWWPSWTPASPTPRRSRRDSPPD